MKRGLRGLFARFLPVALVAGVCVGVAGLNSTAAAATPPQLDLKVLLIGEGSADPTTAAWQSALTSEGVPFDLVTANGTDPGAKTVTLPALSDGSTHGHYNGVVIADNPLDYLAGQLDSLFAYESAFGVRQIDGYMFPLPSLGVTFATGTNGSLNGKVAQLTTAGLALLPGLKGPLPFDDGSFGYGATVTPGAPYTSIIQDVAGNTMAGVYQHPSTDAQAGVAELSLHFNYNASQLHWLLLAPGLINWVTQNTHLGLHRNYFGQDIDDVFIADNAWSSQYQCTPGATQPLDFNCPPGVAGKPADTPPDTLMTEQDVAHVVSWQQQTGIKLNLAFNAVGACTGPTAQTTSNPVQCTGGTAPYALPGFNVDTTAPDASALTTALLANKAQFNWIMHTWSHAFLGCQVWGPQGLTSVIANPSGGTFAAGPQSYQVTAATAYGESEPSAAQTATLAAGGSATLNWTEASNGTGDGGTTPGPTLAQLRAKYSGGTGFWGYNVYRLKPDATYGLVGQVPEAANPTAATTYSFTDTGITPGAAPDSSATDPTATNPGIGCTDAGWVKATDIQQEIGWDQAFAAANGFTSLSPAQYSQDALVTGEHSGVENPNMPTALNAVGVTTFAQDASRQPTQYSLGNAIGAPRYPSNIYYNASNWTDQLNEYNTLYVTAGASIGGTSVGRCVNTSSTTCRATPATQADFLASESHIMLSHVLANNPRVGYAHQPNLIGGSNSADGYTLLTLLSNMLDQYNGWYTEPVTQLTDASSAKILAQQTAWANAQAGGKVTASVKNGVVTVTNTGAQVDVPVTVPNGTTVGGAAAFGDSYAGTRSAWTPVGSTPLTLNQNVAPTILSANSAASIVGAAFSTTITTTGAPTAKITETGALPTGITFVDNGNGTATIAGTAAAGTGGSYPLTITATNSSGSATQAFTLTNSEAPTITSPSTATFSTGVAGTYKVTTTGSPTPTITESGTLPTGLTFTAASDGTATIAGTPATGTAATYPVTITATNISGSTATLALTITVTASAAPAITSGNTAFFTLNQAGAAGIITTGSPTPAITETGSLPAGLTFTASPDGTALIQGTPTASGSYPLSITAANGISPNATQNYTVLVQAAPSFTSPASVTFVAGTASSFTVSNSGYPVPAISATGLPSGLTLTDNGNGTATISGTPVAADAGVHNIALAADTFLGTSSQTLVLTINVTPAFASVASATLPAGSVGTFAVTTTGAPTATISQTGLLAGLSFTDNGNGTATITGTPTVADAGAHPVVLTATNSAGSTSQTLTLTVTITAGPAITSAASTSFTAGQSGSFTVTTNGLPLPTLSQTGALPSGMTFTDNGNGTATIAGTPPAGSQGSYPLTLTAANGAGPNGVQNFSLVVNSGLAITSAATATATGGQPFSFVVTTVGTPTPTLTRAGTLPAGISFNANSNGTATLSGTPAATANGVYPLTFTARNSTGTASQAFTLTVSQLPVITSAATTTQTAGTAFTFQVVSTGFPLPTISNASISGQPTVGAQCSPCAGLSLAPAASGGTAVLTGAATLPAGVYTVGGPNAAVPLTATNVGGSANQTLTVTVRAPAAGTVPVFTSAASATATAGTVFTFTVTTAAGTGTTNVTRSGTLPAGVSFSNNGNGTATLTGTPTAASGGTYPLTFTARNTAGTTTQSFVLTVTAKPTITSAARATATIGSTFNFTVVTRGAPIPAIAQTGALPAGLTFTDNNNGTATVSGIPTGAGGSYPLTFSATGSGVTVTQAFALTVNKAPSITSAASATITLRTAFTFTVTAAGYPAPSIARTGTLPRGVTYTNNNNGTATLAGTPTVAGTYNLTLTARNSLGTATQTFTLTVR